MSDLDFDEQLRGAAFAYLDSIGARTGPVTEQQLASFVFEDRRISLIQYMRGIRVVAGLPDALSIRTTFTARPEDRPYEDDDGLDGYRRYKWQGHNHDASDNNAVRHTIESGKPLIYFVGVAKSLYVANYPVWIVGEEPEQEQFIVALDNILREQWNEAILSHPADLALRREYALRTSKARLHQRVFRERVLIAYENQCALCRLRHTRLLDAAHIREDSDGGEPIIPNGLAMCAIHHRAFDAQVLGIRPDYVVEVRPDVLVEHDGPTLQHALQGLHMENLHLPRQLAARPDKELLAERYERFLLAS